ncbi:LLM class flavin-dependent oxidoreductase, partial [Burkholderia cenocepacia]|nr:LLM class flavin-dependent oxidoreductase [Burkholderia cenocepacia]
PALVAQTERLAFGVTASTTYEHPFALARRFSTLDHLSNGRIGWNIVTSYLTSAARVACVVADHPVEPEVARRARQ